MSLTTQVIVLAKSRAIKWVAGFSRSFSDRLLKQVFFPYMAQVGGNPDLQTLELTGLSSTNQVVMNVAGHLYALLFYKPTVVASYVKGTNNATTCTTSGAQDLTLLLNVIGDAAIVWPKGLTLSTGWTMQGNTTATGSTTTATADQAVGLAILGA